MAHRVYHWKHGWIPLDHMAALQKAKGSEHGARKYLASSHAAGHAHGSVVEGSYGGGTHVRGLQPVASEHLPRDRRITAAFSPTSRRFALHDTRGAGTTTSIPEHLGEHLHSQGHTVTGIEPGKLVVRTKTGGTARFNADGSDMHTAEQATHDAKAAEAAKLKVDAAAKHAQSSRITGSISEESAITGQIRTAMKHPGSVVRGNAGQLQQVIDSPSSNSEERAYAQTLIDKLGDKWAKDRLSNADNATLRKVAAGDVPAAAPKYQRDAAIRYANSRVNPNLKAASDDDLGSMLTRAATDDDAQLMSAVLAELEQRDQAARVERETKQRRATAREAIRQARQDALSNQYNQLVDAGHDPEDAYTEVFGVDSVRQRKQSAISQLRAQGFKGAGFDALARDAYRNEMDRLYVAAENATRTHMVNNAGRNAGVSGRSLMVGPEARARKYASDELLTFWKQHGRLTYEDYSAGLLGGQVRQGTAAWI